MAPKSVPDKVAAPVPLSRRLRNLVVTLHLVLGLSAGLLLSITGLTGSILVFRHEIEGLIVPDLRRVTPSDQPPVPLEEIVASVQRARPGARVRQISLAEIPGDSHEVYLAGTEERAYVDPYTARVLGTRDDSASFTGRLFNLHTKLFAGDKGEQVVGWAGFILFTLCISGVILWCPAAVGHLGDRLRVKWSAGPTRVNYDLHRVGGFYAAGLLCLLAITGMALVFDDTFQVIAARITGSPPSPARPKVPTQAGVPQAPAPLHVLLAQADNALPDGKLRRVSFPAKPGAPVIIRKRLLSDIHPNGMSYIYLDPSTAAVLRVDRSDTGTMGQQLMNLRYPVHIGHWGGLITQLLHAAVGLMPALLFITGFRMWWKRTNAKRLHRAKQRPPVVV